MATSETRFQRLLPLRTEFDQDVNSFITLLSR